MPLEQLPDVSLGSKYDSSATVIVILLQRNVLGILVS